MRNVYVWQTLVISENATPGCRGHADNKNMSLVEWPGCMNQDVVSYFFCLQGWCIQLMLKDVFCNSSDFLSGRKKDYLKGEVNKGLNLSHLSTWILHSNYKSLVILELSPAQVIIIFLIHSRVFVPACLRVLKVLHIMTNNIPRLNVFPLLSGTGNNTPSGDGREDRLSDAGVTVHHHGLWQQESCSCCRKWIPWWGLRSWMMASTGESQKVLKSTTMSAIRALHWWEQDLSYRLWKSDNSGKLEKKESWLDRLHTFGVDRCPDRFTDNILQCDGSVSTMNTWVPDRKRSLEGHFSVIFRHFPEIARHLINILIGF